MGCGASIPPPPQPHVSEAPIEPPVQGPPAAALVSPVATAEGAAPQPPLETERVADAAGATEDVPVKLDEEILIASFKPESRKGLKKAMERREAVSAEGYDADPGFIPPVFEKTAEVRETILVSISANPLFNHLEQAQLHTVISAMQQEDIELNREVISEGDEVGDRCYVVGTGTYAAFKGSTRLVAYATGDLFGELAVMYGCKRAATVVCETAGTLWSLDRKTFKNILKGTYEVTSDAAGEYLKTVPMLAGLTTEQRLRVTAALSSEPYHDGEYILRQGEVGEKLYVIKSGVVIATRDDGTELAKMTQGEFFGESALEGSAEPRKANVLAQGEVVVLSISASDFDAIIGSLTEVLQHNLNQKIVDSIELLSYLSRGQRNELVENLQTAKVAAGTVLLAEGEAGASFFVIKSGECDVTQRPPGGGPADDPVLIAHLESGGYFGERSLLKSEPCNATVTAKTDCVLMMLGMADFQAILGKNLQQIIDEEIRQRDELARRVRAGASGSLRFEDLEELTVLGEGSFGRVKLTRHVPTGRALALKCLRKGQLIKHKQVEHVVNEKAVMLLCKHPFVIRLEAVFQSTDQVYMALQICLGGELFSLLRVAGRLEDQHSRFYAAIVVSSFSYLHERYICHRDLKPENLLFDKLGYLKLVDMGFAKVVRDRTWTLCGTPEYLAPEIIGNKGHNQGVDWWTLGVLLFEMAAGYPAFSGTDQMAMYKKITSGRVKYPPTMSATCKDCISKLLVINPSQRLGCLKGGSKDVRQHPFFASIDFKKLEACEYPAPFVPKLKDSFDTSNYDKYPDDTEQTAYWQRHLDPRYDPIWEKNFGRMIR